MFLKMMHILVMLSTRIPIIAFLLWNPLIEVHARWDGAPCTAVESMIPKHGKSQNDTSPFILRIIHATKDETVVPCYEKNKPIRGENSHYYFNELVKFGRSATAKPTGLIESWFAFGYFWDRKS